ncbi:hypothetical protein RchiOBHm_Chr7g0201011 [Rosa chinensis]|uniref:Uncharacterized protein n=1 Tax=Rosa chinensis TaxID=74649 RepID=A0A2P6P7T8_ROSCH|nr:hypothetical protein RchiOBHm_Chr7g0201011 [Rosa chinensis]
MLTVLNNMVSRLFANSVFFFHHAQVLRTLGNFSSSGETNLQIYRWGVTSFQFRKSSMYILKRIDFAFFLFEGELDRGELGYV